MRPELSGTAIDETAGWLRDADRVTVLTGAGISTESGIPDFRGPDGVWTRDPAAVGLVSLPDYLADEDVRRRAWLSRRDNPAWHATPNAAHLALVELERAGRLWATITQNIDGLHQRAGADPSRVIELHGTLYQVECLQCGRRVPMTEVLDRVASGDPDPACTACGGIQKAATIAFGQQLDRSVLSTATAAAAGADVFVAIGTSLTVHPAAGLVDLAAAAGARIVIVNAEPTPYDEVAARRFAAPIGVVVPALVRRVLSANG